MLKCNYGESYSPWTPWENTSNKTLGRLMPLLNQGKEQPGLSIGSPSPHTLPMQLLRPPSCHPQTSKCYFPQVLHEKNGKRKGKGRSFLSALLPRACWWSATWTRGWEDETVGQTRDSLILWAAMGRLQTADTEKGELLQVRRLTTREHCLAARRWQSSWEEAPASGTQKVQQEFTMCKALKENPGRKRMQAHSPTDSGNRSRVTLSIKMWVAMSPLYGIKTSRLPAQLSLPTECKWSVFSIVFALHNSVIFWWFCVCHLLVTYTNVAKQWVSSWHFHTCLWWALPHSPPHYSLLFPVPMTANIFHLPELSTSTYMLCSCLFVCLYART